jgi:hypothetical protein
MELRVSFARESDRKAVHSHMPAIPLLFELTFLHVADPVSGIFESYVKYGPLLEFVGAVGCDTSSLDEPLSYGT